MTSSQALRSLLMMATLLLAACSPGRTGGADDDPGGLSTPDGGAMSQVCPAQRTRCNGTRFQTCSGGVFRDTASCLMTQTCDDKLGCVDCQPSRGPFCQGDEIHQCGTDGKTGPIVQTCKTGMCKGGFCQCDAKGVDLIYVVDQDYNLLSFDPSGGKNVFTVLGKLNCPAGSPWPGQSSPATPFSMSVDRDAQAWVLYTSGEIFKVDVNTRACAATSYSKGQAGFQLFGMGFSADVKGSSKEHLFISGGAANAPGKGNLGSVDPATLVATTVGPIQDNGQYGPELTGTADGDLYGYFPGSSGYDSFVGKFDKTTATLSKTWKLQPLNGDVVAWAFAQWGGRYYIFVTTQGILGGNNSMVHLFDPKDGSDTILLKNLPYVIVGAGVSTCAPSELG